MKLFLFFFFLFLADHPNGSFIDYFFFSLFWVWVPSYSYFFSPYYLFLVMMLFSSFLSPPTAGSLLHLWFPFSQFLLARKLTASCLPLQWLCPPFFFFSPVTPFSFLLTHSSPKGNRTRRLLLYEFSPPPFGSVMKGPFRAYSFPFFQPSLLLEAKVRKPTQQPPPVTFTLSLRKSSLSVRSLRILFFIFPLFEFSRFFYRASLNLSFKKSKIFSLHVSALGTLIPPIYFPHFAFPRRNTKLSREKDCLICALLFFSPTSLSNFAFYYPFFWFFSQ